MDPSFVPLSQALFVQYGTTTFNKQRSVTVNYTFTCPFLDVELRYYKSLMLFYASNIATTNPLLLIFRKYIAFGDCGLQNLLIEIKRSLKKNQFHQQQQKCDIHSKKALGRFFTPRLKIRIKSEEQIKFFTRLKLLKHRLSSQTCHNLSILLTDNLLPTPHPFHQISRTNHFDISIHIS